MAFHIRILSWALIFILRLRFPPGKSIATTITVNALRSHCQPRLRAIVLWPLKQIWEVSILGNEDNKLLQICKPD